MTGLLDLIRVFIARLKGEAPEIPSPPNMLPWADIELIDNGETCEIVIKNIPKPVLIQSCDFDTNSQDGFFDIGHSSVYILNRAFIEEWAHVGAVISFRVMDNGQLIGRLHQIVEESFDNNGWYCVTRGMNCGYNDPWRIRLDDITGIVYFPLWTEFIEGKYLYVSDEEIK